MKVIIAKINELKGPDISFVTKMLRVCSELGISPPAYVRTTEGLLEALKNYKNQEVVLFTNFPPDDTYSSSVFQNGNPSEKDTKQLTDEKDTYSQSIYFFAKIGINRTFREIHFFTCAPFQIISDDFFSLLAPGSFVKVNRIENCFLEMPKYEAVYGDYILDRVKELVYQCF